MIVTRSSARNILAMMGSIDVAALDTRDKRVTLAELLTTADEGADAVMMKNCPANNPVECIKVIRAFTGLGLKESKDLLTSLDPLQKGGTIGPIPISTTFDDAVRNLGNGTRMHPFTTSIILDPA